MLAMPAWYKASRWWRGDLGTAGRRVGVGHGQTQGNRISKQRQGFGEVGFVPCGPLDFTSQ